LAIAQYIGKEDNIIDITVAIDKLDKIGYEKVCDELRGKGFSEEDIEKLNPIFSLSGSNENKIESLRGILTSEDAVKGLDELEFVLNKCRVLGIENIEFDITLARGLNYYTGAIMEVKATDVEIGSICGGGRYDNLTGIFGHQGLSGVGISFGADRIYDCLEQLNLFPENICTSSDILFTNFGENEALFALKCARNLRANGIKAEVFPDAAKLKKQMNYANDKQIKFVALIGENEIKENKVSLKNMETGEQFLISVNELNNFVK
jgi:histidyl-tRNA synthetase